MICKKWPIRRIKISRVILQKIYNQSSHLLLVLLKEGMALELISLQFVNCAELALSSNLVEFTPGRN